MDLWLSLIVNYVQISQSIKNVDNIKKALPTEISLTFVSLICLPIKHLWVVYIYFILNFIYYNFDHLKNKY